MGSMGALRCPVEACGASPAMRWHRRPPPRSRRHRAAGGRATPPAGSTRSASSSRGTRRRPGPAGDGGTGEAARARVRRHPPGQT
jgi:hypothetical protein